MERVLKLLLGTRGGLNVSPQRSRMMAAVRGNGNRSTEVRLRAGLVSAGVRGWTMHARAVLGRPDFWFESERLAVFVDGCFWHGCKKCGHIPKSNNSFWALKLARTKARDSRIRRALRRTGVRVIGIWEHDLADSVSAKVLSITRELAESRGSRLTNENR